MQEQTHEFVATVILSSLLVSQRKSARAPLWIMSQRKNEIHDITALPLCLLTGNPRPDDPFCWSYNSALILVLQGKFLFPAINS